MSRRTALPSALAVGLAAAEKCKNHASTRFEGKGPSFTAGYAGPGPDTVNPPVTRPRDPPRGTGLHR
jgi:hypothetical protein